MNGVNEVEEKNTDIVEKGKVNENKETNEMKENSNMADGSKEESESKEQISLKDILISAAALGTLFACSFLGFRGYDMLWNNRHITTPAHQTISYATGISGHVEYTKYTDGSHDIKIYPGLGHRLFDSELYQDLDGDGDVDRIRRNGPEWKSNQLTKLLVRETDYESHQREFDEADEILQKMMENYFQDN